MSRWMQKRAVCVLETLRQAGLPIGVVTNGSPRKRHTIHLLGLDRMASCVFISGECGCRKPDAAIFRAAASCVGVHPARVLFVGDRRRDDHLGGAQRGHDNGVAAARTPLAAPAVRARGGCDHRGAR